MTAFPPKPLCERLETFWEAPVTLAALLTIPLILLEGGLNPQAAFLCNAAIWLVFTLEFVTVLFACRTWRERVGWVRKSWMDVLIILGTFPIFPVANASIRALRLIRLVRVGRLFILGRLIAIADRHFTLNPLIFTGTIASVVLIVCANALHQIEPTTVPTLASAFWWAFVTATTVGYGDVVPVTPAGRTLAALLMLFGTGLTGAFAAGLATHLISRGQVAEERRLMAELEVLHEEVQAVRALVEEHLKKEP
jgi:voltage-gated potassium channel